jgi:spoIIIJ-associated protein
MSFSGGETGDPLEVETTGETVGEAKWQALRELERLSPGLDKALVRFQVVSEGERGLLGVGYTPARVIASVENGAVDAGGDLTDEAADARNLVAQVTAALGLRCRVDAVEDDERITITCAGSDLGVLIGRHGQTIDSLQYLLNAIAYRRQEGRKQVIVDASGYRARRETMLSSLAVRSAERVLATGEAVGLEPMSSTERKIIHLRLQDFRGVETTSEGTEPNRYIVVSPTAHSRGGNQVSRTDPLLSE